jgi:prepilin-type N-terminal cleavage/methylation domain-containing protein
MDIWRERRGFTLLEMLIVMALIAILAGIVIASLNPARQFAQARDSTRRAHITSIMNAISANIAENEGVFTCSEGDLPAQNAAETMSSVDGDYDIAGCLVPSYISSMPFDPSDDDAYWSDETEYNTGYTIEQDSEGIITICAPSAEIATEICLTR